MLLLYGDETPWKDASPADMEKEMAEWGAYDEAIRAEGIVRSGEALTPTNTATTVRVRDGQPVVTDGPFAETREQLGGFYVIECDTLDQAIEAARRAPNAPSGSVEIRPIMEFD